MAELSLLDFDYDQNDDLTTNENDNRTISYQV